ncbi:hypothetical protein ACQEUV_05620 [Micromonospora aurantiaca (nom. illeg.)]|uniref:hypothetical protein n=1 Tax=Micromonospora aurantiaca (nom. illeg.) TaxID=47850 RepID=UPI003DA50E78
MTWVRPAGAMRGYRVVAVAVVAAVVFLHALQCATGADASTPGVATAPAAIAVSSGDLSAAAVAAGVIDGVDSVRTALADGHHPPLDGRGVAVTACLLLLVLGVAAMAWTLQRWLGCARADRGSPRAPATPLTAVRLLSLLCVSRV